MSNQALRSSFQQLVVQHQLQSPASNRSISRKGRPGRQQQSFKAPGPLGAGQPSRTAEPWQTRAVRADQGTDTTDAAVIQLISDITRQADAAHADIVSRNAAALEGLTEEPGTELKGKLLASIRELQAGLLERETEVS
jgi:hypothetical protein